MKQSEALGRVLGMLEELTERTVKAEAAVQPLLKRIEDLEARPAFDPAQSEVVVLRLVKEEVAKIPPAENGKDADPEQVASLVAEEVERAVAALPAPQDGKSIGVEDVAPLIAEEVGKAIASIPVPRSIKGVIVNREGQAVFTYSDGSTENIGQVAGRDGADVDWAAVENKLREMVDAIPRPQDGKDGRDGFNLEEYDEWFEDDGRTLVRRFERGEDYKEFRHQTVLPRYRKVFKEGESYTRGDIVTWGGNAWHCDNDTMAKPDTEDWSQMVKKGRDGKDAK